MFSVGFRPTAPWRAVCLAVLALVLGVAAPAIARAEARVALVIGNNAYANLPEIAQLQRAVADARAIKETLETLGFEVIYAENATFTQMNDLVFAFSDKLNPGDIAFVYYAGHGVAFGSSNFLLPTDIPMVTKPDGPAQILEQEQRMASRAVTETFVLDRIKASGARVGIVVLDACRDNPLRVTADGGPVRAIGQNDIVLGATRGIVVEPANRVAGVFGIYSANLGQQALDRLGPDDSDPNSPFTRVFIQKLATPGLGIRQVMVETRDTVAALARMVGREQRPGFYDEVEGGDVYLAGGGPTNQVAVVTPIPTAPPVPPQAPPPPVQPQVDRETVFWESVRNSTFRADFEAYLVQYPNGIYAPLARNRIAALTPAPPPIPTPPPAPPPQPPQIAYHFVGPVSPPDPWLALRTRPSSRDGQRIRQMAEGTLFEVIGQQGVWYNVRLRDGTTGWAHSNWIRCCRTLN